MKILTLPIVAAFGLAISSPLFAQEKKKADPAPTAPAKKTNEKPATAPGTAQQKATTKALPMYARADSISVARKTFTMKTKDGREIKHSISETTEIRNGDTAAKLEDIKEGDWVSGTRLKKGDNEYDVVKITRFGARLPKAERVPAKPAKKEASKPEEKTTNRN